MNSLKKIICIGCIGLFAANTGFAATSVNLRHQSSELLQQYLSNDSHKATANNQTDKITFETIRTETDKQRMIHTRLQEKYAGLPVWGGDIIVHQHPSIGMTNKKQTFNGTIYQNLDQDLRSNQLINATQSNKALNTAKEIYRQRNRNVTTLQNVTSEAIVYITKDNKAHYAYKISFFEENPYSGPHNPIFILDAYTMQVYQTWDNIQTFENHRVTSIGGNQGIGKIFYDGSPEHLTPLNMKVETNQCYFENNQTVVKENATQLTTQGSCHSVDTQPDGLFNMEINAPDVNGSYSIASDVYFGANAIEDLYQQWYGVPALEDNTDKTKQAKLSLFIHIPNWANAGFYGATQTMRFGDGNDETYPFSATDVIAHEVSHGFTWQHSNLNYNRESGGINESFSDMASKALEFRLTGKNQWTVGLGINKDGRPMCYMDDPKKDGTSVDNIKAYQGIIGGLDVHFSSGIFNKAFYLLATSPGWDTKKAFDIMMEANQFYWTSNSTFQEGACGVYEATQQLHYNVNDVENAFAQVGLTGSSSCQMTPIPDTDTTHICPRPLSGQDALDMQDLPCHYVQKQFERKGDYHIVPPSIRLDPKTTPLVLTNYGSSDNPLKIDINCENQPVKSIVLPKHDGTTLTCNSSVMTISISRKAEDGYDPGLDLQVRVANNPD